MMDSTSKRQRLLNKHIIVYDLPSHSSGLSLGVSIMEGFSIDDAIQNHLKTLPCTRPVAIASAYVGDGAPLYAIIPKSYIVSSDIVNSL